MLTSTFPVISCVMPTKGRADYLNQSIVYFLQQQYPNKELIIIYDQSSDLPADVIKHPSITFHQMTDNQSIGAKRSHGCSLAQGEIIAQWDDDDWYSPERLSVQVEPILRQIAELTALRNHSFYNLWDDTFWQTSPSLYNMIFREGVAGGTLMFIKKLWSVGTIDYHGNNLREDADFMGLMIKFGGRLKAVDGKAHFIYIRHLKNSWSFVSGKLLKPSEWQQTLAPDGFAIDAKFYEQLRLKHYASFCQNEELTSTSMVTCIVKVTNEAQLRHAFKLMSAQTYPLLEAVVISECQLTPAQESEYQLTHLFTIQFVTISKPVDHHKLLDLISGDIVMYWPENYYWVSPQWITNQVDFLTRHNLELTGLAQPLYFFPKYASCWQYIYPENTENFWLHPASLCFNRTFWQPNFLDKTVDELPPCRRMSHQHLEHFLAIEQGEQPNKTTEPRWFPYDLSAMQDFFTNMNISHFLSQFKHLGIYLLTLVTFSQVFSSNDAAAQTAPLAEFARANVNSEKEISTYYPAFFEQYQPQNALDMIYKIPGFSFNADDDARGFGSNAGNVLVDSNRPISKSEKLTTILSKISIAQVERIEIYQGAQIPLEVSGQTKVANVIRKKHITSGSLLTELNHAPDGTVLPKVEAVVSTQIGHWQANVDIDIGGQPSYRKAKIDYSNNDALTHFDNETFDDARRWLFVNGQGTMDYKEGSLTLSGQFGGERYKGSTNRDTFVNLNSTPQVAESYWQLLSKNASSNGELGIDWTQYFERWQWQSIGLAVVNDQRNENDSFASGIANSVSNNEQHRAFWLQEKLKTEFIFRSTVEQQNSDALSPKFGIELADNKLRSTVNQRVNANTIAPEKVDVSEIRAEIFADFSYQINHSLAVDGGITAEFSKIEVTGDFYNKKNLHYFKPRLSSHYQISSDSDLTLSAEHRVGQLDFSDFARSAQPEDGRNTAGNIDLVPEQITELRTIYNWAFNERGNFKSTLFYQWRDDVLAHILLPNNEQGLGNAGKGQFWGINTELSLPIDVLLPNGLFEISYEYKGSSFNNPNGRTRHISHYIPNWLWMNLRQDLPKYQLSWGVEYWGNYTSKAYLADETIIDQGNKRLKVFVETTRWWDLKVRLQITHFNTGRFIRTRQIYTDPFSEQFNESQISFQEKQPEFTLSIWKSF